MEGFQQKMMWEIWDKNGDAGYRSPYLSHAKRALYHLSYIPELLSLQLNFYWTKNNGYQSTAIKLAIVSSYNQR